MKKQIVLLVSLVTLMSGCSEKTEEAVKVLQDKFENKLVSAAGEGEVALGLYRNQYAVLKERLVRLKTLQKMFLEQVDFAYASNDQRRIGIYESQLMALNTKIPESEKALIEFYEIYQNQKRELFLLKDEISTYKAMGSLSDSLSVTSSYEKRAAHIKDLTNRLNEKAKRAKSLLEVNDLEETFIK